MISERRDKVIESRDYIVGPFTFKTTAGTIVVLAGNGRRVMALKENFLQASNHSADHSYRFGNLRFREKCIRKTTSLSIDHIAASGQGIIFSGKLGGAETVNFSLQFTIEEDALLVKGEFDHSEYNRISLHFLSEKEERFMGFGEQFTYLDLTGKKFPVYVTESGIGRGSQPLTFLVNCFVPTAGGTYYTSYAPMPIFITTGNRCMQFDDHTVYLFDLKKSQKDAVKITIWGRSFSARVFTADTPLELIEKHTRHTGRYAPLPEFAYGTILGIRGGTKVVEEVLDRCLEMNNPVMAIWIEDWEGRRGKDGGPPLWWRWYPDEKLYPDFKNWVKKLKDRNIFVLGYVNPFISVDEHCSIYREGKDNRYYIQHPDGSDYINQAYGSAEYTYVMVDLSNPRAYDWLKGVIKENMIGGGLMGWMADYGEYVPIRSKVYSEGCPVQLHCAFPTLWARLNREVVEESGMLGKIFIFHRSGAMFSNRYAISYWAGDQSPTFDRQNGLASSIVAMISSGISGTAVNHSDIGGFTTIIHPIYKLTRTKEILFRWCEYAAFTPVYRTHDGAYANPLNYQFYDDPEGYEFFSRMGRLHYSLKWYFQELEKDMTKRGTPMIRALYLHYPGEAEARKRPYQYLLGEDILVTPVLRKKATTVRGYVPGGKWVSPWTKQIYCGGRVHTLPALPGYPPVLIRSGSKNEERLLQTFESFLHGETGSPR
jgi:sulfoquinovosidase